MCDVHRYAAEHMIRVYGPQEAAKRARRNYFTILGEGGVIFWADVWVAVSKLVREQGGYDGTRKTT
jgi:hypothetical protein